MKRLNCWEVKRCGREQGGANERELGICPATIAEKYHGIHSGQNGGRVCWVIAGTMCEGEIQGTFAQKYRECADCDFYRTVREEEGEDHFFTTLTLLKWRE
jgi:hypothetical protein